MILSLNKNCWPLRQHLIITTIRASCIYIVLTVFIYYITYTYCKKLYHAQKVIHWWNRKTTRTHPNHLLDTLISLFVLCSIYNGCLQPFSTSRQLESHKTLEQKFIIKITTLNPQGIKECFSFNYFFCFSRYHVPPIAQLPFSHINTCTTHNFSIHSDVGLILEMSALKLLTMANLCYQLRW